MRHLHRRYNSRWSGRASVGYLNGQQSVTYCSTAGLVGRSCGHEDGDRERLSPVLCMTAPFGGPTQSLVLQTHDSVEIEQGSCTQMFAASDARTEKDLLDRSVFSVGTPMRSRWSWVLGVEQRVGVPIAHQISVKNFVAPCRID